ncbi:CaiB/BaiF CoA transferase family protein [Romboutsia sp.]|uniref:CaiB/BaiF CoA transferase family protein n=1 Tax=Romboutsia sp. TaxID=1965302 RepID=UPI003F3C9843
MNKQLEGIKVIDFTLFAAGPSCGKMLADWGAEVIKIEPPYGEAARYSPGRKYNPTFECYNANKKGMTINLKKAEGLEILHKLLKEADVFLTSYRTDALKRLGLDYETLKEVHPHLVWAQINGFGDYGPDAAKPGFDTVAYWARSGAMGDYVEKGSPIMNVPIAFGDLSTACSLAAGICAALYNKTKTGKGEKVMVSLYGQAIYSLSNSLITMQDGDYYPKTRKLPMTPLMNTFKCKDDKWIVLTAIEYERYYPEICKIISREDLIDDTRYNNIMEGIKNGKEFTEILDEGFSKLTQEEAIKALVEADVAHERVKQTKDIFTDTQAIDNKYLTEYKARDGRVYTHPVAPVKFGDIEVEEEKNAPLLGEDTISILQSLEYDEEEIKKLLLENVVTTVKK